jgi:hypothetical protein
MDIVHTAAWSPSTDATPLDSVPAPCASAIRSGVGWALPGANPNGRGRALRSQRASVFMARTDSFTAPPSGAIQASHIGPSGTKIRPCGGSSGP